MRSFKKVLSIIVILGVVVVGGMWFYAASPTTTRPVVPSTAENDHDLIEAGRYVAIASDCAACHSKPGGAPFAGGLPLASPIGTIYSSNITPDATNGIGKYTLADFDRAIRYGIKPNGDTLYPAMPYPSYARMSDQDVRALYAYFMHEVTPSAVADRDEGIAWPFSIRWPLGIWRKTFSPVSAVVPPDPTKYKDATIARGAYLVQSLGHCGSCHTPRSWSLQEVSLDESQSSYLSGGQVIDGWFAVNLRGNDAAGLGRWSPQDIVDVLRSARNTHSAVVGSPMSDVVVHSMQDMTEPDLQAIAAYLKSLPATDTVHFVANDSTAKALAAGTENGRGAQLYLDNCAACHKSSGQGSARIFPAIAGNASVLASNPASLIRLVLSGSAMPATKTAPSDIGMPGFAWRLSDAEAAQVISFIRQSWGNSAQSVSPDDVAAVRAALAKEDKDKPIVTGSAY